MCVNVEMLCECAAISSNILKWFRNLNKQSIKVKISSDFRLLFAWAWTSISILCCKWPGKWLSKRFVNDLKLIYTHFDEMFETALSKSTYVLTFLINTKLYDRIISTWTIAEHYLSFVYDWPKINSLKWFTQKKKFIKSVCQLSSRSSRIGGIFGIFRCYIKLVFSLYFWIHLEYFIWRFFFSAFKMKGIFLSSTGIKNESLLHWDWALSHSIYDLAVFFRCSAVDILQSHHKLYSFAYEQLYFPSLWRAHTCVTRPFKHFHTNSNKQMNIWNHNNRIRHSSLCLLNCAEDQNIY